MREYMRREFDEIYIINLGGDLLGTRKTPNVFNIQTPVAIAIGMRSKAKHQSVPAKVKYLRIEADSRDAKLQALETLLTTSGASWEEVSSDWMAPFYPRSNASYFFWPELTDIFPWQHSGAQMKRVWPIAETKALLQKRWDIFCAAGMEQRKKYFKETRDRKIAKNYDDFLGNKLEAIGEAKIGSQVPEMEAYSYRAFDRQFAMIDNRIGDYLRPPLVRARSTRNVFFSSLMTKMLGSGAAIVATPDLPDLDFFCGRGGKDVIPLYRDVSAAEPNITSDASHSN